MFEMITGFIAANGLWAVAALMFLENLFPPIPSELIMPLAGYNVAQGKMSLIPVIIAGSLGSLLGLSVWYWLASLLPAERIERFVRSHGRWVGADMRSLRVARRWFRKYGALAVLFGRVMPGLRTLISVPAGMIRMPWPKFMIFSAIGSVIWTSFLTGLGFVLDAQYEKISGWLDPISTGVLIVCVLAYTWRVLTFSASVNSTAKGPRKSSGADGSAQSPDR